MRLFLNNYAQKRNPVRYIANICVLLTASQGTNIKYKYFYQKLLLQ